MKRKLTKSGRFYHRRGMIMVLAAMIFTAVCIMAGLVIDLGVSYVQISRLQTAADAAAFAAATLLPFPSTAAGATQRAQAEQMVRDYVIKNGDLEDKVSSIDFMQDVFVDTEEGPLCTSVRVELQRDVRYFFAPIIGIDSRTVSRPAKVRVEAVIGSQKVAPLGISLERRESTIVGESVAITFDTKDEEVINGNFGSLDLDGGGGGATEFFSDYVNGYDKDIIFNDMNHLVEGQTGVLLGKARDAFTARFNACTHFPTQGGCTLEHYVATCPRIIIIVIHRRVTESPPHRYLPLGYSPYILQSFSEKSLYVAPLTLRVKVGKSLPLTDLTYDFGLLRNRLVE